MSDMRMDVRERPDGVTVITLEGVLDKRSSGALEQSLRELGDKGKQKLVVNCERLTHLSSDGMGVFLSYLIKIRKAGGDIKFCSMRNEVQAVLSVLGLSKLLVVKPSEADAVAEFADAGAVRGKDPQKLRIEVSQERGVAVVALYGFVDRHTIGSLDETLTRCIEQGQLNIVIDCAELTYISSNGMGVFISYVSKVRPQGGDIRLCSLRDVARTVITMLGLHRHFQLFETRAEAVASFAG